MKDKNIIMMHRSYADLSVFEKVSYERWKLLNPEYKLRFFTNEEADQFVYDLFPHYRRTYDNFHLGAKNNVKRACVLHALGGLYVDCDTYPVKPIRDFMPDNADEVVFAHSERGMFCNGIFAAPKGSKLMHRIASGGIYNMLSTPQPPEDVVAADWECWASWHFDTTGVHHYNQCFSEAGHTVETAHKGCFFHTHHLPDYPKEDVCTVHYGTAAWHPSHIRKPAEEQEREQHAILDVIRDHFNH